MTSKQRTWQTLCEPKYGKPIRILIWKNGEFDCPGQAITMHPKHMRSWNATLNYLTLVLSPRFGAVRRLYHLNTKKFITCLQDIKPNEKYLAVGGDKVKFKKDGYLVVEGISKGKLSKSGSDFEIVKNFNVKSLKNFMAYAKKKKRTIVYFMVSGRDCQTPIKVVLTQDDLLDYNMILEYLAHRLDVGEGIQHLFQVNGKIINDPVELKHGELYIAVPHASSFIPLDYREIFKKLLPDKNLNALSNNNIPKKKRKKKKTQVDEKIEPVYASRLEPVQEGIEEDTEEQLYNQAFETKTKEYVEIQLEDVNEIGKRDNEEINVNHPSHSSISGMLQDKYFNERGQNADYRILINKSVSARRCFCVVSPKQSSVDQEGIDKISNKQTFETKTKKDGKIQLKEEDNEIVIRDNEEIDMNHSNHSSASGVLEDKHFSDRDQSADYRSLTNKSVAAQRCFCPVCPKKLNVYQEDIEKKFNKQIFDTKTKKDGKIQLKEDNEIVIRDNEEIDMNHSNHSSASGVLGDKHFSDRDQSADYRSLTNKSVAAQRCFCPVCPKKLNVYQEDIEEKFNKQIFDTKTKKDGKIQLKEEDNEIVIRDNEEINMNHSNHSSVSGVLEDKHFSEIDQSVDYRSLTNKSVTAQRCFCVVSPKQSNVDQEDINEISNKQTFETKTKKDVEIQLKEKDNEIAKRDNEEIDMNHSNQSSTSGVLENKHFSEKDQSADYRSLTNNSVAAQRCAICHVDQKDFEDTEILDTNCNEYAREFQEKVDEIITDVIVAEKILNEIVDNTTLQMKQTAALTTMHSWSRLLIDESREETVESSILQYNSSINANINNQQKSKSNIATETRFSERNLTTFADLAQKKLNEQQKESICPFNCKTPDVVPETSDKDIEANSISKKGVSFASLENLNQATNTDIQKPAHEVSTHELTCAIPSLVEVKVFLGNDKFACGAIKVKDNFTSTEDLERSVLDASNQTPHSELNHRETQKTNLNEGTVNSDPIHRQCLRENSLTFSCSDITIPN